MSIDFNYAQARVQARLAERLSEDGWRLLESSISLAQYLQSARTTVLAPRVHHFSITVSPHTIDQSLRQDWRKQVAAVCGWVPPRWRSALSWTAWLPYLPTIAYLLDDGMVLQWMRDDPALADVALADFDERLLSLDESPFKKLVSAGGNSGLERYWFNNWRALWPSVRNDERSGLQQLTRNCADFLAVTRDRECGATHRREARDQLARTSTHLIRTRTAQPVIIFCHLLLTALDYLRLRDGLLRRGLHNDIAREVAT